VSRLSRRNARDAATTERYLLALHNNMQARIDAGDLDFDDVIYRTRDAAATLLEVRGVDVNE
jgi:hypothetical protein